MASPPIFWGKSGISRSNPQGQYYIWKQSELRDLVLAIGWVWTPTMQIGSGCTVHLHADELPN